MTNKQTRSLLLTVLLCLELVAFAFLMTRPEVTAETRLSYAEETVDDEFDFL